MQLQWFRDIKLSTKAKDEDLPKYRGVTRLFIP
jgi:hypothetical protein